MTRHPDTAGGLAADLLAARELRRELHELIQDGRRVQRGLDATRKELDTGATNIAEVAAALVREALAPMIVELQRQIARDAEALRAKQDIANEEVRQQTARLLGIESPDALLIYVLASVADEMRDAIRKAVKQEIQRRIADWEARVVANAASLSPEGFLGMTALSAQVRPPKRGHRGG
jgi:hypothetical protein